MTTYIFNGKVLPERANVNISALKVQMQAEDAGVSGEAMLSVGASQVSVVLNTTGVKADLPTLKNYVEYLVRIAIDAYGYLSGRGYDIEITSVVDLDGKQTVFGVGVAELERAQNERPLSFQDLWGVVIPKSQHFCRALGDLREAIRSPWDTGFFCYRAVECIRQSFRKEEDGNKQALSWRRLRDALRINRSWLKELEKFAVPQRHGGTPYMSGKDRILLMQHAWKVIDRFCAYVYRDFKPLPQNEFDML